MSSNYLKCRDCGQFIPVGSYPEKCEKCKTLRKLSCGWVKPDPVELKKQDIVNIEKNIKSLKKSIWKDVLVVLLWLGVGTLATIFIWWPHLLGL